MAWNVGDRKVPWVKRLFDLIGEAEPDTTDPVARSALFTPSDAQVFRHWQKLDNDGLVGYIASTSFAATLPAGERDRLLDDVRRLYDGYGRGPDGLLLPWHTHCYRARVSGLAAQAGSHGDDGYDDDALLIDFS